MHLKPLWISASFQLLLVMFVLNLNISTTQPRDCIQNYVNKFTNQCFNLLVYCPVYSVKTKLAITEQSINPPKWHISTTSLKVTWGNRHLKKAKRLNVWNAVIVTTKSYCKKKIITTTTFNKLDIHRVLPH